MGSKITGPALATGTLAAATLVGKLVRVLVVQVPEGGQRRKNMGTRSLKGVWLWICNTTGVEGSELGVGRRKV